MDRGCNYKMQEKRITVVASRVTVHLGPWHALILCTEGKWDAFASECQHMPESERGTSRKARGSGRESHRSEHERSWWEVREPVLRVSLCESSCSSWQIYHFLFICREASFLSDQTSQKSRNANDQMGPNQDVRNRDSQQGAAPNGVDNGSAMAKEVRSLNFCSWFCIHWTGRACSWFFLVLF
jgi:hypothetical protein